MKVAWLLLATLAVAANASSIITTTPVVKQTDDGWMDKQTKVLNLLSWGKMKEAYENEYYDWDIEHQAEYYTDKGAYHYFLKYYKSGDFIPREASYSLHSPKAWNQTVALFELFYSAKDFETFYKTACWARKHVNFGNFAYAFSVAIFNRPDCKGLEVPPFYEIFPNFFVQSDFMQKAYKAKMTGQHNWKQMLNYTGYEYNYYTGYYGGVMKGYHEGQKFNEFKVSYFREDVALNDFYARWFLHWPTWFNTHKYHTPEWHNRGELFYYFHQQLFARYVLERFANDLPTTELLYWDKPIKTGYNPNMITPKGYPLFARPDYYTLKNYFPYGVWKAQNYERKIIDAIDARLLLGYNNTLYSFRGVEGTDYIGKAFAGIPEDVKTSYYGQWFWNGLKTLAFAVKTGTDKHFIGGPTGYTFTALRDPAYYQFLHRMIKYIQEYKKYLPYYTHKEVGYPGVRIESFDVDKLVTYFDYFDFDVTYGLGMGKNEHKKDFHYVAKQIRLNHKPYTYKLTVNSEKTEDAMVRIFMGPKYDSNGHELTIEQSRMAFFEMDRFPVKLTTGQNVFERSSRDSTVFVKDFTTTRTFKEYVTKYTKSYPNYQETFHCGFPEHFQLPKGKKAGSPFVFYAIVTPFDHKYTPHQEEKYYENFVQCGGSKYYDYKPYGYPFDRVVPFDHEFYTPNMYFKDVLVYHKDDKDFAYVSHHDGMTPVNTEHFTTV